LSGDKKTVWQMILWRLTSYLINQSIKAIFNTRAFQYFNESII